MWELHGWVGGAHALKSGDPGLSSPNPRTVPLIEVFRGFSHSAGHDSVLPYLSQLIIFNDHNIRHYRNLGIESVVKLTTN